MVRVLPYGQIPGFHLRNPFFKMLRESPYISYINYIAAYVRDMVTYSGAWGFQLLHNWLPNDILNRLSEGQPHW